MITKTVLIGLAAVTAAPALATQQPRGPRPRVEVWTNRGDDVVARGDRVRVFLRADRDAFVTVFRVDTDGRVRVLFPREPWEDSYVRREREYEIEGLRDRAAFTVDDYPGVGYVFAIVAADPFDYRAIVAGDHWDYRTIADGRVRGDPYVALTDLAQSIVAEGYEDWDYDLASYYVERHYDYPRFVCYDCHAYASWTYWNPYAYSCWQFRIVIYDDPWYYPYRYYGGTRVVWVRPYRPQPRYVFKEWGPAGRDRDPFITRERQRPPGEGRERAVRTSRFDSGSIPAPRSRDRYRPGGGDDDRPDRPNRPDRPDQPNRPDRPDRPDQPNRPDRPDRPDRSNRADQSSRADRPDRPSRSSGAERSSLTERRTPGGSASGGEARNPASRSDRPSTRSTPQPSVRRAPDDARGASARGTERAQPSRTARPAQGSRESGSRPSARGSPRPPSSAKGTSRGTTGGRAQPKPSTPKLKRRSD